jgi:hypothetical protein
MKYGDGKIMSIIDEEELNDEQKKALKDLSKKVKTSEDTPDDDKGR